MSSAQALLDDLYLNGFLNAKGKPCIATAGNSGFRKLGPPKLRERATCLDGVWAGSARKEQALTVREYTVDPQCAQAVCQFRKCAGIGPKAPQKGGSRMQGAASFSHYSCTEICAGAAKVHFATLVLRSCNFQAGATKQVRSAWCIILAMKACPAMFRQPP